MEDDNATPTDDAAATAERPRRIRVLKGGQAAFNQEHSAVPCIVRDLSETGAKIEFNLGWIVPETFTLFVELDGFKVECAKVWHKGSIYGVRFIGPRMPTELARKQRVDLYDARNVQEPVKQEAEAPQTFDRRPTIKRPVFGKFK
jgi:hypothetical protein